MDLGWVRWDYSDVYAGGCWWRIISWWFECRKIYRSMELGAAVVTERSRNAGAGEKFRSEEVGLL
jgi:hypothetical protein